jgi:hypothetical protein
MSTPIQDIREYYERIDANDTEWVLSLFSPDATYQRAGMEYRGMQEIRDFFCVQRKIRGTHLIDQIWRVEADIVIAMGRFEGVGAAGDPRTVGFADVWRFDGNQRVTRRETFLGLGHSYVAA